MACFHPIIFQNLKREMAKRKISVTILSRCLGISKTLLQDKLDGTVPINLDEAMRIAKIFFPECDIYYLFRELTPQEDPRFTA